MERGAKRRFSPTFNHTQGAGLQRRRVGEFEVVP
jgi:hypothetical protein